MLVEPEAYLPTELQEDIISNSDFESLFNGAASSVSSVTDVELTRPPLPPPPDNGGQDYTLKDLGDVLK